MNRNTKLVLVAVTSAVLATQAGAAAIDVTSVTSGIADAGTAILAVLGALMAMSVTIFGLGKAYRFVSKKAGA